MAKPESKPMATKRPSMQRGILHKATEKTKTDFSRLLQPVKPARTGAASRSEVVDRACGHVAGENLDAVQPADCAVVTHQQKTQVGDRDIIRHSKPVAEIIGDVFARGVRPEAQCGFLTVTAVTE